MKKITIIVMSDYKLDPRVYKHAVTAKKNGFDVDVVSFVASVNHEHVEDVDGIRVHYYNSDIQKVMDHVKMVLIKYKLYRMVSFLYNLMFYTTDLSSNGHSSVDLSKQNIIDRMFKQKPVKLNNNLSDLKGYLYCYVIMNVYLYFKIRKIKSDVYLINDLPVLLTGVMLSIGNWRPLIYDSHELWVDSSESISKIYKQLLSWHERILIPFASRVVTVNNHIADTLVERYGVKRPLVVFNCPMYSKPLDHNVTFNNKVIYQGRYYITRGLEETIESARYIDCNLYFRGFDYYNGSYTSTLLAMITTDNVFFIQPVDMKDLVSSLDGFDVGLVPYKPTLLNHIYASPNKLFEYMMAGMAVIGSDLPVIREVIISSGCGMVFNPDDPKSIANAITTIMHDPEKLASMKASACNAAKERWNWEIQSAPLICEYRKLMEI